MGLEQLSDDELIQKIRQEHPLRGGNAAFETLWTRHAAYVEVLLHGLRHRIPAGIDPQSFLEEARQQTSINLRRRVHGYRGPDRFRPYLSEVVRSAVLDRCRDALRTMRREQADPNVPEVSDAAPVFRSRLFFPRPEGIVAGKERREIVRQALVLHAQQSHKHLKSAKAIRWRYWDEQRITDIARSFRVDERSVYRLLHDDYLDLRLMLKRHFRIEQISDI
jgi:DNA-directed RNA polymerase specialized sigma24 family protein